MMSEKMERKDGRWQTNRSVTFQKYIFADTTDPDDLRIRLHNVAGMTKMLGTGDDIIPIRPEEEEFLRRIGGTEHIIGKSRAYCEGDKIAVINGPLTGMEGRVEWTDKRQKLVGVKLNFMNQEMVIKLAAEFVRKEQDDTCEQKPES